MRCPLCEEEAEAFEVRETDPVIGVASTTCGGCSATVVLDITVLRALRRPHSVACSLRHGGEECTCEPPF